MEGLEKIRARMYSPMSKSNIEYCLNGKVKVVIYSDLDKYGSIEELLDPYMSVVILYPNPGDSDVGHWCTIFTNVGTDRLEYFDSYGCFCDDKVQEYNESIDLMHKPKRLEPKLLELVLKSSYADNFHWNDEPLQSNRLATATCGIWCVMRLKNKHINEYDFAKLYYDLPISEGVLPDLLVSEVILNLYPELMVHPIPSAPSEILSST